MEIHFQCNLSDYDEALKAQRSVKRTKVSVVAGFALVFIAEVIAVNLGVRQGVAGLVVGTFCLVLWLSMLWLRPIWVKKDFRNHPNFQREQTLRIDDDGLHRKSEVEQSETRWAAFTGYQETRNLFLLYLGMRLVQVIPKRALSDADAEDLRQLLRKKIPREAASLQAQKP